MSHNLQQKYDQLNRLCKRQQKQISKLQNQIKQRCQNYLLHSSRFKKYEGTSSQTGKLQIHSNTSSRVRQQQQTSRSAISSSSDRSQNRFQFNKQIKLFITKQLDIFIEPDRSQINIKNNQISIITQSFKNRIILIQNSKNQVIKQLQKVNKDFKDISMKYKVMQNQIEMISKSQRKLKDKLKKIPQFQQKIQQIYQNLIRQGRLQGCNDDRSINQKLLQIINWIVDSKKQIQLLMNNNNDKQQQKSDGQGQIIEIQRPFELIEQMRLKQQSPQKYKLKRQIQNYTIISKLNSIQIKPFNNMDNIEIRQQNLFNIQNNRQYINKILQQNNGIYQQQINQLINENNQLKQILNKNTIINKEYKQSNLILQKIIEQNNRYKQQINIQLINLKQQLNIKIIDNNKLLIKIQQILKQNQILKKIIQQQNQIKNNIILNLNQQKLINKSIHQDLKNSQIKINQLQSSKNIKDLDTTYKSNTFDKLNTTYNDLTQSKLILNQQLQSPYFVEEDLQNSSNHQYVKRSFIRKKIVRRNLSATAYRIVSKSKQEVDQIISNKIKQYRNDKSRQKAALIKLPHKIQKSIKLQPLQGDLNRVSEVSEPRDSDINRQEVRIIEVTTTTPKQQIRTAKIYNKDGDSKLLTRFKY